MAPPDELLLTCSWAAAESSVRCSERGCSVSWVKLSSFLSHVYNQKPIHSQLGIIQIFNSKWQTWWNTNKKNNFELYLWTVLFSRPTCFYNAFYILSSRELYWFWFITWAAAAAAYSLVSMSRAPFACCPHPPAESPSVCPAGSRICTPALLHRWNSFRRNVFLEN